MLRFCIAVSLVLGVTALGVWAEGRPNNDTPKPRNFEVRIITGDAGFAFDQKDLDIQVGDTVTWTNDTGATHTATSLSDSDISFDTGNIEKKKFSQRIKFDKTGTAKYHCIFHPMTGTITVSASSAPGRGR